MSSSPPQAIHDFLNTLEKSTTEREMVKMTLSDPRKKPSEWKNVYIKPVQLKSGYRLNFVYRYSAKDITKNYSVEESVKLVNQMLQHDFYKADLFLSSASHHLSVTKNEKAILSVKKSLPREMPNLLHNKEKKRFVMADNNVYLHSLGITSTDGKVKSDKQDKFRQINKYVEIVDSIVKEAQLPNHFRIADMGSGKGYLTFALYDYLKNALHLSPEMTGVELRPELVEKCNTLATEAAFEHLHFTTGSIDTAELSSPDMLIALHACDIATDQAIARGIQANSKVIICAPCCHKQIRKQLHPSNDLKSITRFGILEERQAEILTDTIRALILEAYGYKTKVFEFISTEHTPKNVLIVGIQTMKQEKPNAVVLERIRQLKALFNIGYHELERILGLHNEI
ncbi:MAG: SAM-dependent methyltransferase [Bacteroidetes bacterium]|nr:SAM-dependent methyltransferase [Bacteroidota bacterium]